MEEQNHFYIEENDKKYQATIITNFEIYGDNYCIYTIQKEDTKEYKVYCDKIVENRFVKITDEKEKQLAKKIVLELMET